MKTFSNAIAIIAVFTLGGALQAQAAPITLQTVVHKEELVVNAAGETETLLLPVTTAVPGDQVIYTVTFANQGDEPATGVTVVDPIPDQMRYVAGSASGPGTDITFSVDGGHSFALAADLEVTATSGAARAARAEDFTHIRWVFRGELEPGAQGVARFRAVLD